MFGKEQLGRPHEVHITAKPTSSQSRTAAVALALRVDVHSARADVVAAEHHVCHEQLAAFPMHTHERGVVFLLQPHHLQAQTCA